MTTLPFKLLHPKATLPTRGSEFAAGLDLYPVDAGMLPPGERCVVATGIACAIPLGHYGRVAPRSGWAAKLGIDVLAGVLDQDYRGEIKVVLLNTGNLPFAWHPSGPIAQLILERCSLMEPVQVEDLDATARGDGGFGSTGTAVRGKFW